MTAADHANTVREGLQSYVDDVCPDPEFMEARGHAWFAALDALQTQAETAEEWRKEYMACAHALSDRIHRSEAAEAERDHARDALRQIEVVTRRAIKEGFLHQADWKEVGHIARAALGNKP